MKRIGKYSALFIIFLILQLVVAGGILLLDQGNLNNTLNAPLSSNSSGPDVGPLLTAGLLIIIDVLLIAPIISISLFTATTHLLKRLNRFWDVRVYKKALVVSFVGSLSLLVILVIEGLISNVYITRIDAQFRQETEMENKGFYWGCVGYADDCYYMDMDGKKVDVPALPSNTDPIRISDITGDVINRMLTDPSFYISLTLPILAGGFYAIVLFIEEGIILLVKKARKKKA